VNAKSIVVAALIAVLAGCSSTDVVRAPLDVSIGQQLIDLKKARDNGVLSASEYDTQRRRLIDSVQ
jgi:type IV pilus biogenesis protein CpaD/CtpE